MTETKEESSRNKTILFVDDEQWIMSGVVDSLSVDYRVLTASNADDALLILEERAENVDLILLDIMMPVGQRVDDPRRGRTTGVGFARIALREMKLDIPIICYTVVDDADVVAELTKIGVSQIVFKDKLPSQLEAIIKRHLSAPSKA